MGTAMLMAALMALPAQGKADVSKLVGTWAVTSAEKDGKEQTAASLKGRNVQITRDTITWYDPDRKAEMAARYEINTSRTPWQIEMTCTEGEHKGKKVRGIMQLEGDTLKVCYAKPDKEAPTSFKTATDQCGFTLKRAAR